LPPLTKYGIGAVADSAGAGRQPTTPAKVALGKLLFWTAFVGTPRRSLRDVPSSKNGYAEDRDLALGVTGIGLGSSRGKRPAVRFRSSNAIVRRL